MKKLLGFIFGLVLFGLITIGVLVGGVYVYVKQTYGIDIVKTISELQTLQEPVDEAVLCPNAYSPDDMVDVKEIVNQSVDGFITYTEEQGYIINFDNLPDEMKNIIKLTDKQVCAIAREVVEQEIEGKVDFGGEKVNVDLKQVDFYGITADSAYFNVVILVDMTPLKKPVNDQVLDYLAGLVPDKMYVSSTVLVTHDGQPFGYSVKHENLKINNLTAEETEDLFHTLDVVFKVGEAQKWNTYVGETIMNALVGNETQNGLAYGLKEIGATDYAFIEEGGKEYFQVLR